MISYTWSVRSMQSHPQEGGFTNVVHRVEWMLTAVDGDFEARVGGHTDLNPIVPNDFTDYANLTETQVLDWVLGILGTDTIAALEASLADSIATMQNPPITILPLPWG